jgi:hypothetical protein
MNKWVIGIGSFVISAIFVSFFFYLQKSRLTSINEITQPTTTTVNIPQADLSPQIIKTAQKEAEVLQIQRRGTIISIDPTEQTFSVINYDPRGLENEYLFDVSYKNLNQVLCWPATRQVGNETMEMKDAFIQLNTNGNLNLNNEVVVQNPIFSEYLGKFIFIKLKNATQNQVLEAEQIAILDC